MTRRWLIDLPTRIHLWTAEQEIRHRTSSHPERLRNLDVLREYRKSRAFPRNDTSLGRTPYFVDRAGRHCAVGQLMRGSGDEQLVRRIAADANLARIDDMDPVVLSGWTERSGLTKRELARIQPQYPNETQWVVNLMLWTSFLMIPYALLAAGLNRMPPDRREARMTVLAGTVALLTALTFVACPYVLPGGEPAALVTAAWFVALLGPAIVAFLLVNQVRRGRADPVTLPGTAGLVMGAVGSVLAAAYVVLGLLWTPEPEPQRGSDPLWVPPPSGGASSTPGFLVPAGLVGLVAGLVVLVGFVRLRRRTA
ncbi:hypothetical protein [Kribbella solani]|uniref:hypothetical protein n=1 Tax=Kribbella solani TaxID=236067 RepID=UPI0029A99B6A|nr:hypothetical protein [Kribbella solani]MDX2973260.1 hypothetical protein [Kribbella solani]